MCLSIERHIRSNVYVVETSYCTLEPVFPFLFPFTFLLRAHCRIRPWNLFYVPQYCQFFYVNSIHIFWYTWRFMFQNYEVEISGQMFTIGEEMRIHHTHARTHTHTHTHTHAHTHTHTHTHCFNVNFSMWTWVNRLPLILLFHLLLNWSSFWDRSELSMSSLKRVPTTKSSLGILFVQFFNFQHHTTLDRVGIIFSVNMSKPSQPTFLHIISLTGSNPRSSPSSSLLVLSISLTPHIHLIILISVRFSFNSC